LFATMRQRPEQAAHKRLEDIVSGVFTPVLAKHSKSFSLIDCISPRTMWSLSNAFTSAFKELDPVPQFKTTAKLGAFVSQLPA